MGLFCLNEATRADFCLFAEANRTDLPLLPAKLFFCTAFLLMRALADFSRLLSAPAVCRFFNVVMPGLEFLFAAPNARFWADSARLLAFLSCGPILVPPGGLSAAVDVPGLPGVVDDVPLFIVPVPGLPGL